MALSLYRGRRSECDGRHPEDFRTGEFEEGRRGWKKCACLIHASGTLGGKFSRRQTGKTDWDEAKAVVANWEAAQSWDGLARIEKTGPQVPEPSSGRITLDRAIEAITAEIGGTLPTHERHPGVPFLVACQSSNCRKEMSTIKTFFEFCLSNEWIARNRA
jgi:hypothetical protein